MTQDEYNVTKQQQRKLHYIFNVLNYDFQKVDEISGVILSCNWSIDANSDIRRTANVTLSPDTITKYKIQSGSVIWLDKYIQIYVGIEKNGTNEIIYSNMGIYLVNNPSQVYNTREDTITLSLVDLMAKLTTLRGGSLDGYEYQVKRDSDIRDVIISILKENKFNKYIINIEDGDYTKVQNDINVSANGTYYDILKELNDINPNYQMFFDVNGVFNYIKIPSGKNESVMVDDDIWNEVYINHRVNTNYENLKNDIIVLGKTHEINNYLRIGTVAGNTIYASCASVTNETYKVGLKVGFVATTNITSQPYLNLNNKGSLKIINENGTIPTLEQGKYYVLSMARTKGVRYWNFLGELTPRAEVQETNEESPFYVNGTIGKLTIVLSGGEYDNIYSQSLAEQRAKWELYTRCRILDNISIECVPIYWLDVNKVIQIKLPNEDEPKKYIVQSINIDGNVSGTQSLVASTYYSYYDW